MPLKGTLVLILCCVFSLSCDTTTNEASEQVSGITGATPDENTAPDTEDDIPPTIAAFGPLNGSTIPTFGDPFRLYASYTDNQSGPIRAQLTDGTGRDLSDQITLFDNGLEFQKSRVVEGHYDYRLKVSDAQGNSVEQKKTFFVDASIPITTLSPAPGIYREGSIEVSFSVSEPAHLHYSLDGHPPVPGDGSTGTTLLSKSKQVHVIKLSRNTVLHFYSIDKNGNRETLRKATYLFGKSLARPTDVTAKKGPGGNRLVRWRPSNPKPSSYRVYQTVNAIELEMLRASHTSGHPAPAGLPFTTAKGNAAGFQLPLSPYPPGSKLWIAVSAVHGTWRESAVSEPIAVAIPASRPAAARSPDKALRQAVDWLLAQQHTSGWWGTEVAGRTHQTALALRALYYYQQMHQQVAATQPAQKRMRWPIERGLQFLETSRGADNHDLALASETLALFGHDISQRAAELLAKSHNHHTWGRRPFYHADVLSTAAATSALRWSIAPLITGADNKRALLALGDRSHLLWPGRYGAHANAPTTIYASLMVYRSLDVEPAAYQWIQQRQSPTACFGNSILTTAAVLRWLPFSKRAASKRCRRFLLERQHPGGSFGTDIMLTAMAIEGLAAYDLNLAKQTPPIAIIRADGVRVSSLEISLPEGGDPAHLHLQASLHPSNQEDIPLANKAQAAYAPRWHARNTTSIGFASANRWKTEATVTAPGDYLIYIEATSSGDRPIRAPLRVTVLPAPQVTATQTTNQAAPSTTSSTVSTTADKNVHLLYTPSELDPDGLKVAAFVPRPRQAIQLRRSDEEYYQSLSFSSNNTVDAAVLIARPGDYQFQTIQGKRRDRQKTHVSVVVGDPTSIAARDAKVVSLPQPDFQSPRRKLFTHRLVQLANEAVRIQIQAPVYPTSAYPAPISPESETRYTWRIADNSDAMEIDPQGAQATAIFPSYGTYRLLVRAEREGTIHTSALLVRVDPQQVFDSTDELVVPVDLRFFFDGDATQEAAVWEATYSAGPVNFLQTAGNPHQWIAFSVPGRYVISQVDRRDRHTVYRRYMVSAVPPDTAPPAHRQSVQIMTGGDRRIEAAPAPFVTTTQLTAFVFVKDISPAQAQLEWKTLRGPAPVAFTKKHAAITTAQFDAPGDYQLECRVTALQKTYTEAFRVKVAPKTDDLLLHIEFETLSQGIVSNPPPHLVATGIPGNKAVAFSEGENLTIPLADQSDLTQSLNSYTIALWVRLPHTNRQSVMHPLTWSTNSRLEVAFDNRVDSDVLLFNLPGGNLYFGYPKEAGKGPQKDKENLPVANQWMHLAVVYNGNRAKTFYNGKPTWYNVARPPGMTSVAFAGTDIRQIQIGQPTGIPDQRFDGHIDDVRVYQIALSDDQIEELYRESPLSSLSGSGE